MKASPTSGADFDLVLLGAAQIGDEPDQTGVAVGPRLERPRPQAAGGVRREHAHAHLRDDVPDAGEMIFFGHEHRNPLRGWAVPAIAPPVLPEKAKKTAFGFSGLLLIAVRSRELPQKAGRATLQCAIAAERIGRPSLCAEFC